jgi:hypothetical protein
VYEETMNGLGIEEADEDFVAALKKDKQGWRFEASSICMSWCSILWISTVAFMAYHFEQDQLSREVIHVRFINISSISMLCIPFDILYILLEIPLNSGSETTYISRHIEVWILKANKNLSYDNTDTWTLNMPSSVCRHTAGLSRNSCPVWWRFPAIGPSFIRCDPTPDYCSRAYTVKQS